MINNLKELNVLYIDDDKVACKNMENTLSYFFKEVFCEHNGLNALDTFKKEDIHLLLVDYDMPIMNGVSFLQEVIKVAIHANPKSTFFIFFSFLRPNPAVRYNSSV